MATRTSFIRATQNSSGNLENHILVFDTAANSVQTATASANMAGVDLANWSDNFVKVELDLEDTSGTVATKTIFMLPNASESYDFDGTFVKAVRSQAAVQPTASGLASSLTVATTASAGVIDVNYIEN